MLLLKEHKETLLHYIDTFPNRWKSEIMKDWDSFSFCTPSLRSLRNSYGPRWLLSLTAAKVKEAKVRCTRCPLTMPHFEHD